MAICKSLKIHFVYPSPPPPHKFCMSYCFQMLLGICSPTKSGGGGGGAKGGYHWRFKNRESNKCSTIDCLHSKLFWQDKTVVGLAQLVERLTVERKVLGLIPGAGPLLSVLK